MNRLDILKKIFQPFDRIHQSLGTACIELVDLSGGSPASLYKKTYDDMFTPLDFKQVIEQGPINSITEPAFLTLKANDEKDIHCSVSPVVTENETIAHLITWHREPVAEQSKPLLAYASGVLSLLADIPAGEDPAHTGDHRYKEELMKMRNILKDITLQLEPGDALFYSSTGAKSVTSEDGAMIFGEDRLIQHFIKNMQSPSLEIVHNLTDTLYEFSNYCQNENDILLLSVKKG